METTWQEKRAKARKKKLKKAQKAWFVRRTSGKVLRSPESSSKLKAEVMAAYGGACSRCGTEETSQLQLDHVENNGHQHRLLVSKGRAGIDFYKALKKADFPNREPYKMDVVCFDCHVTTTTERRYGDSE
jgi:hypothetical protein